MGTKFFFPDCNSKSYLFLGCSSKFLSIIEKIVKNSLQNPESQITLLLAYNPRQSIGAFFMSENSPTADSYTIFFPHYIRAPEF